MMTGPGSVAMAAAGTIVSAAVASGAAIIRLRIVAFMSFLLGFGGAAVAVSGLSALLGCRSAIPRESLQLF
jgi:hypothetical protein